MPNSHEGNGKVTNGHSGHEEHSSSGDSDDRTRRPDSSDEIHGGVHGLHYDADDGRGNKNSAMDGRGTIGEKDVDNSNHINFGNEKKQGASPPGHGQPTQTQLQARKSISSFKSGGGGHGDDDDDETASRMQGPSILSVDQSAITGESLAVDKYKGDVAYYTCGVKRGKVYAIATSSAKQSFVGKTADLVLSESSKFPTFIDEGIYLMDVVM